MDISEKFCLKWNEFENSISGAFKELRNEKEFFDVTLACDDDQLQAHKVILSACSPFFRNILRRNKHDHPLLYLKGVKYADLVSVLNFMYQGQVNVAQEELNSFLAVAEELRVRGLSQNNDQLGEKKTSSTSQLIDSADHISAKPAMVKKQKQKPPSFPSDPKIQEINPVKSEPIHSETAVVEQSYSNNTQSNHSTLVEQNYSDTNQQFHMGGVSVYDDYSDYRGYEETGDGYVGTIVQDDNKALDDLIAQSMSQIIDETGVKLWNCDLCNRSNKSKQEIRRHMERHLEVQHQCPHCETQVQTREALRRHISRYHKF